MTLFHVGLFIAALLISVAVWQMRYYKNVLSTIRLRNLKRRDFLFYSRQAGRRFQMHGLLGLAGLGMAVGFYIPHTRPLLWTVLWIFVIIFLCWAMLLGLVDYLSIKLYYLGMERQNKVEKIQREYELHQFIKEQKEKDELMKSSQKDVENKKNDDNN